MLQSMDNRLLPSPRLPILPSVHLMRTAIHWLHHLDIKPKSNKKVCVSTDTKERSHSAQGKISKVDGWMSRGNLINLPTQFADGKPH